MTPAQEQEYAELRARLRARGCPARRRGTPARPEYRSRLVGDRRVWTDHAGHQISYSQLPKEIRDAVGKGGAEYAMVPWDARQR